MLVVSGNIKVFKGNSGEEIRTVLSGTELYTFVEYVGKLMNLIREEAKEADDLDGFVEFFDHFPNHELGDDYDAALETYIGIASFAAALKTSGHKRPSIDDFEADSRRLLSFFFFFGGLEDPNTVTLYTAVFNLFHSIARQLVDAEQVEADSEEEKQEMLEKLAFTRDKLAEILDILRGVGERGMKLSFSPAFE
jgi:hypothetical protein